MESLNRIFRYINHGSIWLPLLSLASVFLLVWRFGSISIPYVVLVSLISFVAPYWFRHFLASRTANVTRPAFIASVVLLAVLVRADRIELSLLSQVGIVGLIVTLFGIIFWVASEPITEMKQWLAFPTEYGRPPDKIALVDKRRLSWPDEEIDPMCYLFRFQYGPDVDYGIVGPVTFALGDSEFTGKSYEEIYDVFRAWYADENIAELVRGERRDEREPE